MSVNTNNNVEGKPDDHPVTPDHPTESDANLPFTANYMMALLNSIQQTTNNIYNQQAVDAKSLTMLQEYMQTIQKDWSANINNYINENSGKDSNGDSKYTNEVAATVSQMQAQMSAEVEKANSVVGSMKSTLGNDITNASQILNFFDSLTTITSFTSSLLR